MNTFIDSLIGRQVIFTVSEPWDYVSPYGDNNLYGEIIQFRNTKDGDQDIVCNMKPFTMDKKIITEVIASKRHTLKKTLPELLLTIDWGASVNVGCEKSIDEKTQEPLSDTIFLFIGGMQLLEKT